MACDKTYFPHIWMQPLTASSEKNKNIFTKQLRVDMEGTGIKYGSFKMYEIALTFTSKTGDFWPVSKGHIAPWIFNNN